MAAGDLRYCLTGKFLAWDARPVQQDGQWWIPSEKYTCEYGDLTIKELVANALNEHNPEVLESLKDATQDAAKIAFVNHLIAIGAVQAEWRIATI